jgi:hypothetical protein
MAQHVPIQALPQKVFQRIDTSIRRDFKNTYVRGSLKYELLENRIGKDYMDGFKENENDVVYLTNRYIGKGFIWGDTHGDFEIHFDSKTKQMLNIYLVA